MKKTYQGRPDKSKQKFEVLGKRELLVEVPLPLAGGRPLTRRTDFDFDSLRDWMTASAPPTE